MKTINAKLPTVCVVMFVVAIQMSGQPFVSVANSQSTNPDTKTAAVDPAAEINAANQLVRDGKFTDAIDAYSAIEAPETSDQLDYNLAIAHYRNGDFDAAATLFSKVAGAADSLANKSQYNLGNCHYAKSLKRIQPTQQQAQQELKPAVKEAAISDLRSAILAYRGSLRGNPDNADARANIELAVELIKKLEEETPPEDEKEDEKEEQEKKDQENQQNEDQKQDEQQQDEQQQDEQQQENKEGQGKDDQKGEPDKEQKQDGDDEKAENKDDNEQEKNDEKNKPGENQDEQKPNQENGKDGKEDDQQQQQNSSNDEPGKEEPGKEQQGKEEQEKEGKKPPAGELTSENQQDQKETDAAEAVAQEGEEKMKLMTNQEALKMLQAVRDRDMLRRFQLQQRERSRRIPVDKDW